jgi:hypothetical protein
LWSEEAALGGRLIRKSPKGLDREEMGKSIMEVFHAVGGVPRLAHWANENYGYFATKLLPKLLPQDKQALVNQGTLNITYIAAIPESPLDAAPIDISSQEVSPYDADAT